jgi:hypothetical protein
MTNIKKAINKGENMEKNDIIFKINSIKGLLLKKIRTNYGFSLREIGVLIDKSEIAIRKYENGDVSIPFSVMFLVVHILKISKKEIEDFLDEVIKENATFTTEEKEKCLKKIKVDIERVFENIIEEIDEDTESNELDKTKLEKQIKLYIKKYIENNGKVDENKITKEIISFINFKMNENIE